MRVLPAWLREFVDVPGSDAELARALTQAGINIEGISQEQGETVFEAEITPNRPDAMNHYGIARECAAIFDKDLKLLSAELGSARPSEAGLPSPASRTHVRRAYLRPGGNLRFLFSSARHPIGLW